MLGFRSSLVNPSNWWYVMKLCLIVLNKSTNLIFVNYLGVTKITMSVNDNTPSVEAAALIYDIFGTL